MCPLCVAREVVWAKILVLLLHSPYIALLCHSFHKTLFVVSEIIPKCRSIVEKEEVHRKWRTLLLFCGYNVLWPWNARIRSNPFGWSCGPLQAEYGLGPSGQVVPSGPATHWCEIRKSAMLGVWRILDSSHAPSTVNLIPPANVLKFLGQGFIQKESTLSELLLPAKVVGHTRA